MWGLKLFIVRARKVINISEGHNQQRAGLLAVQSYTSLITYTFRKDGGEGGRKKGTLRREGNRGNSSIYLIIGRQADRENNRWNEQR